MKNGLQKFGKFLSAMVMPNIGAFIAWGFITALFIADGWIPNAKLASIQPYMLTFLLPMLIAYTGGKQVGGDRGGVMGAIAVMGCIAGVGGFDGQPMLMGAMVMGPFAGWVIKKFDKAMDGHMPAGFEMLINNFSVGILGMIVAIIGYFIIGPFMSTVLAVLTAGVNVLVKAKLIPLAAIFIEPAKVLFLNNAINHGIFTPIGIEQAKEAGKSIMYMLEANPGPGLGVLLAYCLYSKGGMKQSAPGAAIIHALGGIHEIYFPYVLMNPVLIIAPIVGSAAGILIFSIFNAGLVAIPSPGSIFALMALAPKGGLIGVLAGVLASTAVSFVVAAPLVKKASKKLSDDEEVTSENEEVVINKEVINKIVFACDAGMGSSAMGATKFRNRIKNFASNITVINSSVDTIPSDADIVVSHKKLEERARKNSPQANHVFIENFLQDSKLDKLYSILESRAGGKVEPQECVVEEVAASAQVKETSILKSDNIILGLKSESKEEAIERAGKMLVKEGYVNNNYIAAMQEREKIVSTYIGMGIAIPHGVGEAKKEVKESGIVVLQYPDGVVFGDDLAYLVIGIAGVGDDHLEILSNIATSLEDETLVDKLKNTNNKFEILQTFNK